MRPGPVPRPEADRIFEKIVENPETGCWVWQGTRNHRRGGYGVTSLWRGGHWKSGYIHIWMWEYLIGPVPQGLVLDHWCENPPCCNPQHLEPVTRRINTLRGRNNVMAQHARQTQCVNGHEFNAQNTRFHGPENRWRSCLICEHDRGVERWQQMKQGADL